MYVRNEFLLCDANFKCKEFRGLSLSFSITFAYDIAAAYFTGTSKSRFCDDSNIIYII